MPHLIKRSRNRLIVSGNSIEHIEYERPFFYNFPPQKRRPYHFVNDSPETKERRKDNTIRARQKLKRLISANTATNKEMSLFVTYTFAENIDNPEVANPLWSLYVKRLDYFLLTKGFAKAKYITVIEFQKRGAVHYHTLYFNIPYIPDIKIHMARIWKLGFIKIISLKDIRNVSAYVSKYLRKGLVGSRLRNKKAFFGSRNLNRPLLFRDNEQVAIKMINHTYKTELKQEFDSLKYGKVIYTLYSQ